MRAATKKEAWDFVEHMREEFDARIVQRDDAVEYQMIRGVIEAATLGKVDLDELLENYSQTIGPMVYLAPKHTKDPDLLMSIVVHELEHVHQFSRDGLRLPWLYLTTTEGRATYEAHAYASQFEFNHARYGTIPETIAELAMPLEAPAYLLGADEVRLGRSILLSRMTSVAHRTYNGFSAHAAISWAKRNAPGLLVHP